MPVIREKSQFSIQPIGVMRVGDPIPGSNGSAKIAETVVNSANQMADMFFRRGVDLAEKAGAEKAAGVSPTDVILIDPVTGAPKAYEPPKGMGVVAQDAYQRVIASRFQSSIEDEIKLKATELAIKYDGSTDRYTAAMAEYIGAMSESATGQFKGMIVDIGTSYLNATRGSMMLDQLRKERKLAEDAIKSANSAALYSIESAAEQEW